ncbi:cytosolic sulfotransferase 15-like [Gossypium raimondii]|uniref:cytosolic sulfotransferase 15-like n=1 Tax=Gossypium raimondii TaxID=29730 RepID=UPI00227A89BB|nr:cytosolic sulfotransferase 15-like [Gossypium raimondii]
MESKESSLETSTPNVSPSAAASNAYALGLTQFQGFWIPSSRVPTSSIISFQKYFQALDDDIIVASKPKAGTTWLKALVFTIVNRHSYTLSNIPLNSRHQLMTMTPASSRCHILPPQDGGGEVRGGCSGGGNNGNGSGEEEEEENPNLDLSKIPSPRVFSTHLPYSMLADSIKRSNCRIVYITRNPFDIVDCFEIFCRGEESYGPFWDHALGYWNMSVEKPSNILFMRYEELKEDSVAQTKRLVELLRFPFSLEEEKTGVVNQIIDFCSFNNLKDLEVNKTGKMPRSIIPSRSVHGMRPDLTCRNMGGFSHKLFFRSGKVGDYINHLSPTAVERLSNVLKEKLSESSLTFN